MLGIVGTVGLCCFIAIVVGIIKIAVGIVTIVVNCVFSASFSVAATD